MKLSFKLLVVFPFMLFFLGTQDYARLSPQRPKGKLDKAASNENAPQYKVTHYDISS